MSIPRLEIVNYELKMPLTGKIVKYRPFTVKERAILLTAMQQDKIEVMLSSIRDLIKVCTYGECDMEKMPIVEIEYAFLCIKNKSVGEEQPVTHSCDCGAINEFVLNMENIEIIGEVKDKDINLGGNNWLKMHYPSFKDTVTMSADPTEDEVKGVIATCIDTIIVNDSVIKAKDATRVELIEWIDDLTQIQLDKIEAFFESMPKLVINHEYTCPKCGVKHNLKVEGLENFFD